MYQSAGSALKLENIFGPISIDKAVSPALHPNTVPGMGKQRDLLGGNQQAESGVDNKQRLSAYPPGRRRVADNVLYNKNRDLTIKPSPYSLSTNMQLFPWGDRDPSRTTAIGTNWIFDNEGNEHLM